MNMAPPMPNTAANVPPLPSIKDVLVTVSMCTFGSTRGYPSDEQRVHSFLDSRSNTLVSVVVDVWMELMDRDGSHPDAGHPILYEHETIK